MTERQQQLVLDNLDLIKKRCRSISRRKQIDYDQVLRQGYYAACRLAMAWREERDIPFYLYLSKFLLERSIDCHRLEEHRKTNSYTYRTNHQVKVIGDFFYDQLTAQYDDYSALEFADLIASEFPPRDAEIIARKLLLDEPYDEMGERYGITGSRACQIYKSGIARLQELLQQDSDESV
jgi:RNA polymerase sigma factor (sigma-70 family)